MMRYKYLLLALIILAAMVPPASAQSGPEAWTTYLVNMRSGAGAEHSVITTLIPDTALILEARTTDLAWVLVHTADNTYRGWVASLYVRYADEVRPWNLPVSDEVLAAPVPPDSNPPASPPVYGGFDTAQVTWIDLRDYPPTPANLGRAREIFLVGRARGRNPHMISKVGDCMTADAHFLAPLDGGSGSENYQSAVAQFGESFGLRSLAADSGFTTVATLTPTLADPSVCQPDETPLQCEYRVHNSSVAVIMLGTMDLLITTPAQFDTGLREIVQQTIDAGVIPLLSTFPRRKDYPGMDMLYNQIIVHVALDYDIPLVNLWAALEGQPAHGLEVDGWHLNTETGFTTRTLVTLEALQIVLQGAMY
jgi:hypothetical protein